MALLRYASQEAANIAAAEKRARQQAAFDVSLAARKAGVTFQPSDADLTAISSLSPSNGDFMVRAGGTWVNRSPANVKTDLGIMVPVPASATATGAAGQFAYDSNYFYVCIATNTWKRTALSTW